MADEEVKNVRLRVACETAAANTDLGKLADTMGELTKEVVAAGTEQQKLARQVAATTAQVQAATAATNKAKQAQAEHKAVTEAFGKESLEAAESLQRLKAAEQAAEQATRAAEQALSDAARAVTAAADGADKKAVPALKRMNDALQKAGRDADRAAGELRVLEANIESVTKSSGGLRGALGDAFASFKGNLLANAISAVGSGLASAGAYALDTAANYERMKTALETTTGSQAKANAEFERLQAFAAATPFSLEEVTEGYIKLSNRGINANDRLMTSLGNTASAMGKTMDDAVEAMADAITGENERLKEFGIVGKLAGDQVAYTFRGVTTMVKRDAVAIAEYLTTIGEVNFAGGMEKQSRTLGGMWSTMKDGADQFLVSVLDGVTPALKDMMETTSNMSETGEFLENVLSVGLAAAFAVVATAAKVTAVALEGTFTVVNALLSPLGYLEDALIAVGSTREEFEAAAARQADERARADEAEAVRQRYAEAIYQSRARETDGLVMKMHELIGASGQYALALVEEGLQHLAVSDAINKRTAAEDSLWDQLQKRNAKAEDKAIEDAFFAANEMGPSLPPGFKRKSNKKGRKKKDPRAAEHDFDTSVADFEFALTKEVREENAAAAAKAYEIEVSARESQIKSIEREMELLELRGGMEVEQVDMIFYTAERESEAAAAREALVDRQIEAELRLAEWRKDNAATDAERERAVTDLMEAEHRKRVVQLQRQVADEAKTMKQREKMIGTVTSALGQLSNVFVSGIEKMVAGEKGAVASMLADLLKATAKKHAILAMAEAAMAIGSAASFNFGGAALHGQAAAMHGAVTVAAGVGAVAAGRIAESRSGGGGAGGGGGSGGGGGGGGGANGGANGGSGPGWNDSTVPVSRPADNVPRNKGALDGANIYVLGATREDVGVALGKLLRQAGRGGGKDSG
ncbi:tape measure protein [Nannocystis sp. ILAH1]|uniref:tape measure protein n=1 Tax=Nannocystis sp. ILAH1 TaxID=2996789 RepID=UPI00226D69AB|nr:tape measure protein [Nannocystis sp. ILAH1]MCY0985969.1 tape measure protein [Nannocystis sp. ILAH1]